MPRVTLRCIRGERLSLFGDDFKAMPALYQSADNDIFGLAIKLHSRMFR